MEKNTDIVSWSLEVLFCNVLEGSREDKVASSRTRWPSAVSGNHYRIFNKPLVKRGLLINNSPPRSLHVTESWLQTNQMF